jgi:hypothetical protein
MNSDQVSDAILRCLREGKKVEIAGFGTFFPCSSECFRFEAADAPMVFISYVHEDADQAEKLYDTLRANGMHPWMDRRDLKAGQNWPRIIESVIEASDFFIAILSKQAVLKRGGFQAEVRFALDIAAKQPLDDIFLIPARIDKCHVPARLTREWQYIDLFPDWDRGVKRIIEAMQHQVKMKQQARLPEAA